MTPAEERGAFERALHENPYDEVTHRAFSDWCEEHDLPELADFHRLWTKEWQEAKELIQHIAKECGTTYDALMECGQKLHNGCEYFTFGYEQVAPNLPEDQYIDGESIAMNMRAYLWQFRDAWHIVTRQHENGFPWEFSCSC